SVGRLFGRTGRAVGRWPTCRLGANGRHWVSLRSGTARSTPPGTWASSFAAHSPQALGSGDYGGAGALAGCRPFFYSLGTARAKRQRGSPYDNATGLAALPGRRGLGADDASQREPGFAGRRIDTGAGLQSDRSFPLG